MTDVTIERLRTVRVGDEDALQVLLNQVHTHPVTVTADRLRRVIGLGTVIYVARASGRIVSTATACRTVTMAGVTFWLEDVATDPAHRGQGYGQRVLEALLQDIRPQADSIQLTCRPSRIEALALYQKLGFTVRDTRVLRY